MSPQAAVGWKADTGGIQLKLAQTLVLRVQFEGSTLEIHSLPPPGAMHDYQGSSYAEGVVTIYDDTDHDGHLDYGDRVWGVSDQFEIIYVERAPIHLPPRYHRRPLLDDRTSPEVLEIGFNLYHHPGRTAVPPKTVVTVELSETDLSRNYFHPEPSSLCSETDVNCSSLAATLAPQERDRY